MFPGSHINSLSGLNKEISQFDCSPGRQLQRALGSQKQKKSSERWKYGDREGDFPIPIGTVVTLDVPKVDRSHTDPLRIPGVILKRSDHDGKDYYKVRNKCTHI